MEPLDWNIPTRDVNLEIRGIEHGVQRVQMYTAIPV